MCKLSNYLVFCNYHIFYQPSEHSSGVRMCHHWNYYNVRQNFPPGPLRVSESLTLKFTSSSIRLAGNPVASAANPFAQTYNTGSAAAIGAVGGLILLPPIYGLCQLLNCIPNNGKLILIHILLILTVPSPGDSQPEYKCSLSQIFSLARSSWPWVLFLLFLSPFIALIGNSIVFGNDNNWDAVGIGAFGGLVLALPAVLFSSCFHLFVLSIISPIWSAIMKGAQWVHVKLKEIWMNRNHSHSPLARDDPEINLEYQILPGRD